MTLGNGKLYVRKMTMEDLTPLYRILSDGEVMKYLEPPFSRERTREFLIEAGLSDPPLIWAAENDSKRFVGYVIYHDYDENSMELGWVLDRSEWGKGYASILTEMLIADSVDKNKDLVIECCPSQIATKHIAKKYGFAFCGIVDGRELYRLKRSG